MELARGGVGLTCVNLGWTKNKWPDDTKCYRKRKQAQKRAEEMKKNCACGIGSTPQIFSIHFWNNIGKDGAQRRPFQEWKVFNSRTILLLAD